MSNPAFCYTVEVDGVAMAHGPFDGGKCDAYHVQRLMETYRTINPRSVVRTVVDYFADHN